MRNILPHIYYIDVYDDGRRWTTPEVFNANQIIWSVYTKLSFDEKLVTKSVHNYIMYYFRYAWFVLQLERLKTVVFSALLSMYF